MNNYQDLFKKVFMPVCQTATTLVNKCVQKLKNATKDFYIYTSNMKSFRKYIMLAGCIAILLAICTPHAEAEVYQFGNGTGTTYYIPIYYNWTSTNSIELIPYSEISATGATAGGITSLAVQWATWQNLSSTSGASGYRPYYTLYLANVDASMETLPSSSFTYYSGWQEVMSKKSSAVADAENGKTSFSSGEWQTFYFDEPFEYTGGGLLVRWCADRYHCCANTSAYSSTSAYWYGTSVTGRAYYNYTDGAHGPCTTNPSSSSTIRLNYRLDIGPTVETKNIYTGPVTDGPNPVPAVMPTSFGANELGCLPTGSNYYYYVHYASTHVSFSPLEMQQPGKIIGLAPYLVAGCYYTYWGIRSKDDIDSVLIYMRNSSSPMTNQGIDANTGSGMSGTPSTRHAAMLADNWVCVKGTKAAWNMTQTVTSSGMPYSYCGTSPSSFPYKQWANVKLDEPFEYEGGYLDIAFLNYYDGYMYGTCYGWAHTVPGAYTAYYYDGNNSSDPNFYGGTWYKGTMSANKPLLRITFEEPDNSEVLNQYQRARVSQSDVKFTMPFKKDIPILNLTITTKGDLPPYQTLNSVTFSGKGSIGKIDRAKLYYTADKQKFDLSAATLISTLDFVTGTHTNTDEFVFNDFDPVLIGNPRGSYNFWLAYDVSRNCPEGANMLDAMFEGMNISGVTEFDPPVDSPDPAGAIAVQTATYFYTGPVTGTANTPANATSTWYYFGYPYLVGSTFQSYSAEEMNFMPPGVITSLGIYGYKSMNSTDPEGFWDSSCIYVKNASTPTATWGAGINGMYTSLSSQLVSAYNYADVHKQLVNAGYTCVKGPWNIHRDFTTTTRWNDIELDIPFYYTGGVLDVAFVRYCLGWAFNTSSSYYGYNTGGYLYISQNGPAGYQYGYNSSTPSWTYPPWYGPTTTFGSTSQGTNTGYRALIRLYVDIPINELIATYPTHNSLFYKGETMPGFERPHITYYRPKNIGDVPQWSYRIIRKSDGALVYQAKSGNGAGDTLMPCSGYGVDDISSYPFTATGIIASPNGSIDMLAVNEDVYEVHTRFYVGSTTTPVEVRVTEFTIKEPFAVYTSMTPWNRDPVIKGATLPPSQYPGIRYYMPSPTMLPPIITYTITSVATGDVVYTALSEETGLPEIELNMFTLGDNTYNFRNATGVGAVTSGVSMGQLNTFPLDKGWYYIDVTFDNRAPVSLPQRYRDSVMITDEYDIGIISVDFPQTRLTTPGTPYILNAAIPLEYVIYNYGVHSVAAFNMTIKIYNASGQVIKTVIDTVNNPSYPMPPVSMRNYVAKERLVLSNPDFVIGGNYYITAELEMINPAEPEAVYTNNFWPEDNLTRRYFSVQPAQALTAGQWIHPVQGGDYRYPVFPTIPISNTGTIDISGIAMTLDITGPTGSGYHKTWTKLLDNLPPGAVNYPFQFDSIFFPIEPGQYSFSLTYSIDGVPQTPINRNINISAGLGQAGGVTRFTIGRGSGANHFATIENAMAALFHRGVAGHIIFELIPNDAVKKEFNAWKTNVLSTGDPVIGAARADTFSLFDFRSRIMGLGPDATITFTLSEPDLTSPTPVTLIIRNNSGYGLAFGNAHSNKLDSPAVNIVYDQDLRNYLSHSEGYITFDGGPRRNLVIKLENTYVEGTNTFAAPIFMDNGAKNIAIKNCIIEGTLSSMLFSTKVPNVNYVVNLDGTATFNFDTLLVARVEPESNISNKMVIRRNIKTPISAGVFFYNKPIEREFILDNWYVFDRNTSDNNVIEGNIIRGFGYGIFSLGMGGMVNNQLTVDPMYNTGNKFLNNYIENVNAAGIFLGFEKDAVVSGNRVNSVLGLGLENSVIAGIQLGLNVPEKPIDPSRPVPSYMYPDIDLSLNNTNILIEKNEVTNVLSDNSAFGIVIYESTNTLRFMGKDYALLDAVSPSYLDNKYTITNNMIYKIYSQTESVANRVGIAIAPSKDDFDIDEHKINKVLIANNTIIVDDETYMNDNNIISAEGKVISGIQLFDVNNYEIINNAIYVRINPNVEYDYISALSLRGLNPKLLHEHNRTGIIDYNAYFIDRISTSPTVVSNPRTNDSVSFVRFFEIDKYGRLLDNGGFAKEYSTLRNWTIWTEADPNSINYNFYNTTQNNAYRYYMNEYKHEYIPDPFGIYTYNRLRFVDTMYKVVSLLDRGKLIGYVDTDIDNISRLITGKVFNIGAVEFYSKHLYSDIEVKSIVSPGGYLGNVYGGDNAGNAEQVMIDRNQAVYVTAIVRNNGQTHLSNIPIYCNITGPGAPALQSLNVSLAVGEQKEITFCTAPNYFRPSVGTNYAQYISMATTVSNVYTISVYNSRNSFLDDNTTNDSVQIRVRFFVPQSTLGLLVSAKHSDANIVANTYSRVDQDIVAGKLNFDTVVSALNSMSYYQTAPNEGTHHFDVLNRDAWEPRNVNYSMYSAVIWSDAHDDVLSFWEKQSLINYVHSATPILKRTLIVNSEEMLVNNGRDFDPFNIELQDNVINSRYPHSYTKPTIIIRGEEQNYNLEIVVDATGYHAEYATPSPDEQYFELDDIGPNPYKFSLIDTSLGKNHIAYYFYMGTKPSLLDTAIATVSHKSSERNAIYTAIDWRHLKNASAYMRGIFNDVAKDFWTVDTALLSTDVANFNANSIGKSVLLDWQTLTETGISNFEIQRANVSDNNIGIFNSVLSKQGAGYSKTLKDYNIFDYDVNYDNEYAYRLKINQFDGNYTYSPVKIVNIEYADGIKFGEVIPNPTNESSAMEYSINKDANIRISITDLSGREIVELFNGYVKTGTHKVNIDATKLASGSYNINYFIDDKISAKVTMFTVVK